VGWGNIHALFHSCFHHSFLYMYSKPSLISPNTMPPYGSATLYYLLHAQLFLLPWNTFHREYTKYPQKSQAVLKCPVCHSVHLTENRVTMVPMATSQPIKQGMREERVNHIIRTHTSTAWVSKYTPEMSATTSLLMF
jgi:hypothetical protein